jgi:hypothetical protein
MSPAGPFAFPLKQPLLLLHHPHPDFAMQLPQFGVNVAQSCCVAGGVVDGGVGVTLVLLGWLGGGVAGGAEGGGCAGGF